MSSRACGFANTSGRVRRQWGGVRLASVESCLKLRDVGAQAVC